jgi:hypothetical protein
MNVRSAALGLMFLLGLLPASAVAFTEIEVRQDHDGAGPSHIFHLHDSVVAVVDPLDGTISAYADTHGAPVRTASIPVGFHPWRLVRLPGSVAIISEDGHSRIEVARDQAAWPREFALSEHHASDAAYRIAPLLRTPGGISLQPFRGAGALPIRAIGPYYVASARELERFGDGRRYVLWKEYYLSEPPPEEPDEQRIKVNVYVGRFERDGRLSGLAALPIAVMSRVGFDYATVLPDGTMALLASIVADGKPGPFKIYHLAFVKPSPYLAALQKTVDRARHWAYPPSVADIFPIAEPKAVIAAVEGGRVLAGTQWSKHVRCRCARRWAGKWTRIETIAGLYSRRTGAIRVPRSSCPASRSTAATSRASCSRPSRNDCARPWQCAAYPTTGVAAIRLTVSTTRSSAVSSPAISVEPSGQLVLSGSRRESIVPDSYPISGTSTTTPGPRNCLILPSR